MNGRKYFIESMKGEEKKPDVRISIRAQRMSISIVGYCEGFYKFRVKRKRKRKKKKLTSSKMMNSSLCVRHDEK